MFAAQKGPGAFIRAAAQALKKNPKATILVGKNKYAGFSVELLESKNNKWLLDGWSLDAFAAREAVGVGVAKDIANIGAFQIDAGVYTTVPTVDFFSTRLKLLEPHAGISVSWKF